MGKMLGKTNSFKMSEAKRKKRRKKKVINETTAAMPFKLYN